MKKHFTRALALILCMVLLCCTLSGCSGLIEKLSELDFLKKHLSKGTEYILPEKTDFYAAPSWDSPVVATFYEGTAVTYTNTVIDNDTTWAQTEQGWFPLEGTKPVIFLNRYDVNKKGFATEALVTYDTPALSAAQYDRLTAGTPVQIAQIAETQEGFWAETDRGWAPLGSIYVAGETGRNPGYGVSREEVVFLSAPGVQSNLVKTLESGMRFEILEQIQIDGYWYGYSDGGWVSMNSVYVEGTEGQRPCYAMVIDSTPLNVRIAPGTDNQVLTQLHYGDYVTILEQVKRDGKDWGYTGEGWIFMDLTEIQ